MIKTIQYFLSLKNAIIKINVFEGGRHMKAIIVKQPGGAGQLQVGEQPKPEPKTGELLIKVKAAAINRTDIIKRKSRYGYLDNQLLTVEVAEVVDVAGE